MWKIIAPVLLLIVLGIKVGDKTIFHHIAGAITNSFIEDINKTSRDEK